jgi:hypothetical protein
MVLLLTSAQTEADEVERRDGGDWFGESDTPFPSVNVTRWNRALANPIFHGVKSVMFVAGDERIEGGSQSPCATSKLAARRPPMPYAAHYESAC